MNKILLTLIICLSPLCSFAQETVNEYVRNGYDVTLRLAWKENNYGTIKWQKSGDLGATWLDIEGATNKEYTFKASADTLYKVIVNGDEACKPYSKIFKMLLAKFTVQVSSVSSNSALFKISNLNIPADEIVEYGFCYNLYSLSRAYSLMQRVAIGTHPNDATTFNMNLTGLSPNSQYSAVVYFKTKNGSIIYGPTRALTTTSGVEWSSEDWQITKTSVVAKFKLSGYSGTAPKATFKFGTADNMQTINATMNSSYIFTSDTIKNLQPGTDYTATATVAFSNGEQTISKTVRTFTDYSKYVVDNTVTRPSHQIVWGSNPTRIQLSPDNIQSEYPRFLRVSADTILLSYHGGEGTGENVDHWRNLYLHRSTDNGKTWGLPVKIMTNAASIHGNNFYRFCNPEMIKLRNGWILMPFIGNGNPETNANCQVLVMISKDGGETWGDPITVGRGRTWEPQIVQLPGGELELLVSSEAAWWAQSHYNMQQEILCSRSSDNGLTWTAFRRASYYSGRRDGMPCAVVLKGNKGVIFSEESILNNTSPYIVHRDLDGEWNDTPWNGIISSQRWICPLNAFGAAPYMIQLPTGEVILSAHAGTNGEVWQTGFPRIITGDNTGHNFTRLTIPFTSSNVPYGQGIYYNSLFLKDEETVWLAITHCTYDGSNCERNDIEYIEGKIEKF
jgi:hypothetical protein